MNNSNFRIFHSSERVHSVWRQKHRARRVAAPGRVCIVPRCWQWILHCGVITSRDYDADTHSVRSAASGVQLETHADGRRCVSQRTKRSLPVAPQPARRKQLVWQVPAICCHVMPAARSVREARNGSTRSGKRALRSWEQPGICTRFFFSPIVPIIRSPGDRNDSVRAAIQPCTEADVSSPPSSLCVYIPSGSLYTHKTPRYPHAVTGKGDGLCA